MRACIVLTIHLLTFLSCSGQSLKKTDKEQVTVKTNTVQIKNDDNAGIVYFSADNGNTWKNASNGIPQAVRIGLGGLTASGELLALVTKENGVFTYDGKDSRWINVPTEQRILEGNIGAIIRDY